MKASKRVKVGVVLMVLVVTASIVFLSYNDFQGRIVPNTHEAPVEGEAIGVIATAFQYINYKGAFGLTYQPFTVQCSAYPSDFPGVVERWDPNPYNYSFSSWLGFSSPNAIITFEVSYIDGDGERIEYEPVVRQINIASFSGQHTRYDVEPHDVASPFEFFWMSQLGSYNITMTIETDNFYPQREGDLAIYYYTLLLCEESPESGVGYNAIVRLPPVGSGGAQA